MTQHPDIPGFAFADGGVVAPRGFLASGVSAGLKSEGKRDLALVAAEKSVPAAAVFTTNQVAAAPVVVSRRHIANGLARAVVINAGNANACTGAQGEEDAISMARSVASALDCQPGEVVVSSTGVIGVPLPLDKIVSAVPDAVEALDSRAGDDAATAIIGRECEGGCADDGLGARRGSLLHHPGQVGAPVPVCQKRRGGGSLQTKLSRRARRDHSRNESRGEFSGARRMPEIGHPRYPLRLQKVTT